jgi:hypothetical protein
MRGGTFRKRVNGFIKVFVPLWLLLVVWLFVFVYEPPPPPAKVEKPDPAKINARNIEVLRQLLEEETGKQITFMAEGKGVGE